MLDIGWLAAILSSVFLGQAYDSTPFILKVSTSVAIWNLETAPMSSQIPKALTVLPTTCQSEDPVGPIMPVRPLVPGVAVNLQRFGEPSSRASPCLPPRSGVENRSWRLVLAELARHRQVLRQAVHERVEMERRLAQPVGRRCVVKSAGCPGHRAVDSQ